MVSLFTVVLQRLSSRDLRLERVQLSAARIITGLRNSCPNDIVLYEADLQPLSFRRKPNLVKYYNKLLSFGTGNRTSAFLRSWRNNQRLKKNSPFSQVFGDDLIHMDVETHCLNPCIDPTEGLPRVFFHPELPTQVSKSSDIPTYLRQIALELINTISKEATIIYTDGSRNAYSRSGSGVYFKSGNDSCHIKLRNPDGCSVFRSELIAIDAGLNRVLSLPTCTSEDIWILSDSRSAIQHLSN